MRDSQQMLSAPLTYLSLVAWALPLLAMGWLLLKRPLRGWAPIVVLLGLIVLLQIVGEFGGGELLIALMYYLAGAR